MKKNFLKVTISIFMILFTVLFTVSNASSVISGIENNMDLNSSTAQTIKTTGQTILGAMEVVASGVSIVMLIGIAIKYIISAPEERAEYKRTTVSFVIGAVVIFAAPRIASLVMKMSQNVAGKLG